MADDTTKKPDTTAPADKGIIDGALGPVVGAASQTTKNAAEQIEKLTKKSVTKDTAEAILPWAAGGTLALAGAFLWNPIQRATKAAFSFMESLPLVGGLFRGTHEVASWLLIGAAALVGFKAFEVQASPAGPKPDVRHEGAGLAAVAGAGTAMLMPLPKAEPSAAIQKLATALNDPTMTPERQVQIMKNAEGGTFTRSVRWFLNKATLGAIDPPMTAADVNLAYQGATAAASSSGAATPTGPIDPRVAKLTQMLKDGTLTPNTTARTWKSMGTGGAGAGMLGLAGWNAGNNRERDNKEGDAMGAWIATGEQGAAYLGAGLMANHAITGNTIGTRLVPGLGMAVMAADGTYQVYKEENTKTDQEKGRLFTKEEGGLTHKGERTAAVAAEATAFLGTAALTTAALTTTAAAGGTAAVIAGAPVVAVAAPVIAGAAVAYGTKVVADTRIETGRIYENEDQRFQAKTDTRHLISVKYRHGNELADVIKDDHFDISDPAKKAKLSSFICDKIAQCDKIMKENTRSYWIWFSSAATDKHNDASSDRQLYASALDELNQYSAEYLQHVDRAKQKAFQDAKDSITNTDAKLLAGKDDKVEAPVTPAAAVADAANKNPAAKKNGASASAAT